MTSTEKTMKELAQEYLAFRRSLGFQLRVEGQQLLKFAEFVDRSDHSGPLTTELALRWACLPTGASPLYRARRLEVVRGFARFRAIFDDGTEIPAQRLLGEAHRRTAPHVYSDGEISDLLHAAYRNGVALYTVGYVNFSHSDDDIEAALASLEKAVREL